MQLEGEDITLDDIRIIQSVTDTVITIGEDQSTEITLDLVDADKLASYSVTETDDGTRVIIFYEE